MSLKKRIGVFALTAALAVTMSQVTLPTASAEGTNEGPSSETKSSSVEIATTSDGAECVENQVLVFTSEQVTEKQAEKMVNQEGDNLETVETVPGENQSMAVVDTGKTDVEDAVAAYEARDDVKYAQPNYVYRKTADKQSLPSYMYDGFSSTKNLTKYQWGLKTIDAEGAWDLLESKGVQQKAKVAVLDTGLYAKHTEFANINSKTWYNSYKDKEYLKTSQTDPDGHGTHVSGIVTAKNNGAGTSGVAEGKSNNAVELHTVTAFGYLTPIDYVATTESITRGIDYCVKNKFHVINMSLGIVSGYLQEGDDKAMINAVNKAYKNNITVVCAAGNDFTNTVSEYPAQISNCISVANMGSKYLLNESSTYGSTIDIAAPGTGVLSTFPAKLEGGQYVWDSNSYISMTGTSMASPMVAGVASLLYASDKTMTPAKVKKCLYNTTTDLYTTGKDIYSGYGLVNAKRALEARYTGKYVKDTGKRTSKVSSSSVRTHSVRLKWQKVEGATSYSIQKRVKPYLTAFDDVRYFKTVMTVSSSENSARVTDLNCGQKYNFRVMANNTESKYEVGCRASLVGNCATVIPTPSAPTVTLKRYKDHRIKVEWSKVSGATEYRVYRAFSENGKFERMGTFSKDTFSKTFKKLKPQKTYYYKVRAVYKGSGKTVLGTFSELQCKTAL